MNVRLDEKQIGKNIRFYRKQRGWTKAELAERVGIMRELLDHYETSAQVMNLYTIIRIASALNVHPDWLLAWKQEDEE